MCERRHLSTNTSVAHNTNYGSAPSMDHGTGRRDSLVWTSTRALVHKRSGHIIGVMSDTCV